MPTFVIEDHMLDWHTYRICYPLEIKLLLLVVVVLFIIIITSVLRLIE